MSIESTRSIKRSEAIEWLVEIHDDYRKYLESLDNDQLEELLYKETRTTNRFDNFKIEGE